MALNQYYTFAAGGGANVLSPADYLALPARATGFSAGIAPSQQLNTAWRQAATGVAGIAQAVADLTGVDMLDDGSPANFKANFVGLLNFVVAEAIDASGSFGSGGIFGLILANAVANPTTRITISVGQCRDSLNAKNMTLATPLTKRLDAAWSAGDNGGGRDTGALANGQTWHMFLILNPTTTAVDALFSQSPTAPTLPANFTYFRRLGSIVLESASTAIRQFVQHGDYFEYKTRSVDYANQANAGGPFLRAVGAPTGVVNEITFYFQSQGSTAGGPYLSGIYDPANGAPPAFGGPTQWAQVRRTSALDAGSSPYSYGTVIARQFCDTSARIYTYSNDGADVIALGVLGWRDDRGRFY